MSQRMPKRKGRYTKTNQLNQLAAMVNELGQRVANLAAGIVVLETILEDAQVINDERVARIKPLVRKKLGIAEPTPPPAATAPDVQGESQVPPGGSASVDADGTVEVIA